MSRPREWIEDLSYLWRKRGTAKGLLLLLFLLNMVLFAGMATLLVVLEKTGIISSPANYGTFYSLVVAALIILNLAAFVLWLYWRWAPRPSTGKIRVFFCPYSEPDCEELVRKLFDSFRADLKSRDLSSIIDAVELAHRNLIIDPETARAFLERHEGRLVIYGSVSGGNLDGKKVQGFRQIFFTVRHRQLGQSELQSYVGDIAGMIGNRSYLVRDESSFLDHEVISHNVSEVSRFLIGAALTLDGKTQEALRVLRPLMSEVTTRKPKAIRGSPVSQIEKSVSGFVRGALYQAFNAIYEGTVIEQITEATVDEEVAKCETLLDEIEALPGEDGSSNLARAIVAFHRGQLGRAKRLVVAARKALGRTNPAPHFSLAFLSLWRGEFPEALREYRRAAECPGPTPQMSLGVVRFLDGLLEGHPEKRQLRFGVAFVNDEFLDSDRAIAEYRRFIDETEGEEDLRLLREYARERVESLARSEGEVRADVI